MNILFIIGNGFDLNLGMKTRYSDFYKYYKSIPSQSNSVNKLKNAISKDIENWSDLELALGKYTKNLGSAEEFEEVYEDIGDKLADYLQQEENNFDFSKIDGKKLYDYFSFPERSLLPADTNVLNTYKNKWGNSQWNVYLITFNYTHSLERLIEFTGKKNQINSHSNHPIILQRIEHIHGYFDKRMIMGVNDVSQISNSDFHNNQVVLEALVKNNCNQAQKHTIDNWCKNQILNANLICIFGSSIGDTDNMWWKLIGEQLKRDCKLIIFEKGEDISPRRQYKIANVEREKRNSFLKKTKLDKDGKKVAADNIFISVNTDMFSVI